MDIDEQIEECEEMMAKLYNYRHIKPWFNERDFKKNNDYWSWVRAKKKLLNSNMSQRKAVSDVS